MYVYTHISIETEGTLGDGGRRQRIPTTETLGLLPAASGKLQAAVVEKSQTFSRGLMQLLWVIKCPVSSNI